MIATSTRWRRKWCLISRHVVEVPYAMTGLVLGGPKVVHIDGRRGLQDRPPVWAGLHGSESLRPAETR